MNQFEKYKEMKVVMKKIEGLVVSDDMKKDLMAANDLYDKKDYSAAIDAYKAFLVKFPDAYFIWRNIGNSYFLQEKYDEAEAAYKQILVKDPNDVEATISIGNCYANRGNTDGAMEWYNKIALDKITDANLLYSVGLAYFKTSKLEEAQKYFAKAVELDESQHRCHLSAGHDLHRRCRTRSRPSRRSRNTSRSTPIRTGPARSKASWIT